jgi:hypothetical protein
MADYVSRSKSRLDRQFRKAFAREVIKQGFNPRKAYKAMRPHVTDATASTNSCKLMKTQDVQQELDSILRRITPEYVLDGIERIAKEAKKDDTKLNAWVALGRYLSLFKDSPTSQTAVINAIDLDSIKKELANKSDKKQIDTTPDISKSNDSNKIEIIESDNICYDNKVESDGVEGSTAQPPTGV